MKKLKLLPCKIHGTLPKLRERELPDLGRSNTYPYSKKPLTFVEYVCLECEADKEVVEANRHIKAWNDKQK